MKVMNKSIVSATVMNKTITSEAINVDQIYGVAIQAVFTGTPTGTFKLQASCDPALIHNAQPEAPSNWSDIPNSSYTVSGAGNYAWNMFEIMYSYIRLVYTDASGGIWRSTERYLY